MKLLIGILFAFVCLTYAADYKITNPKDIGAVVKECQKETKISDKDLEKYGFLKFPDADPHCYVKCLLEKFDMFDEKFGFNIDSILEQLKSADNAAVKAKITECGLNKDNVDPCVWANNGYKCFYEDFAELVKKAVGQLKAEPAKRELRKPNPKK